MELGIASSTLVCSKCKQVLPINSFYKHGNKRGFSFHCKGCIKVKTRDYYLRNRERIIKTNEAFYKRNPTIRHEVTKRRQQKLKENVLAVYGTLCACCGESEPKFLSIDHVHNDGAREREVMGSSELWLKIIRNKVDRKRYQVLCFNCNCAKGFFGECPHQTQIKQIFKIAKP